ncbi:MAG TPA: S41 family peptidase [Armatimonadota bacterium]|nr:S41 family peptidase [Armatimonadota bacterium]
MKPRSRQFLIAALVISSFLCGFTYRDIGAGHGVLAALQLLPGRVAAAITANLASDDAELKATETYWSVFTYLDANYLGQKPDSKQLTYAAIRGILASLGDRYTRFLDPTEYTQIQEENRGNFEGIGAVLEAKDGRIIVKNPMANTPAERAGLRAGDIILKVDNDMIQGLDITEVAKRIRGHRGTKVKLAIKREGVPKPLEFEIERAVIPFEIVTWKMEDDASKIGYIRLGQFNEKSDEKMDDALTQLERLGMRGLVLDLRENPGGLLDVAVDIGSRFTRGDIVIVQDKGGKRTTFSAEPSKYHDPACPLAVLIDQNSASASEIVAGAIRDHKAGTLVGVDTFGKGLVQTIFNLEGGAAVSVTTMKYFTPSGQDVSREKIHPDVVVELTEQDLKSKKDVQLERAVQILRERLGATQVGTRNEKRDST